MNSHFLVGCGTPVSKHLQIRPGRESVIQLPTLGALQRAPKVPVLVSQLSSGFLVQTQEDPEPAPAQRTHFPIPIDDQQIPKYTLHPTGSISGR